MTAAMPPPEGEALWRKAVDRLLKGADFDAALVARSLDGIALGPLHAKAENAVSAPGRSSATLRVFQPVDHPDAAVANSLALADLQNGADGLVLRFAGAPVSRGFGIAADDLEAILDGLPSDALSLRLETPPFAGADAARAVAAWVDRAARDPATVAIDFGLDPIGDMARTGLCPEPWETVLRAAAIEGAGLAARGFMGPFLRADGRPHHEAGASEAQELAAVLAAGVASLRICDHAAIPLDVARRGIGFVLATDADLFLSLAKVRALRILWARVEEACGLSPEPIRLHAETAWRMLTRRDPWTNLLRGTIACTAAILGGVDSVTVLPVTAALGLPDGFARRLARNTPLVLIAEAGLARIDDPAAGSDAVESLTDRLCETAWPLFQAIEQEGGLPAALASGTWQARIRDSRERRRAALGDGRASIVGTTVFAPPDEVLPGVLFVSPSPDERLSAESSALRFEPLASSRDAEPFETEPAP